MAWSLPTPAVILGVLAAACTSHAPAPTEDAPAQHAPTKHDPAQHAPAPLRPVAIGETDWVVVESTYGDREHAADDTVEVLAAVIGRTVARGGKVIIPAFAVDRTEVLLYHLRQLAEAGRLPPVPVYVDSPMALAALDVYRNAIDGHAEDVRTDLHGDVARVTVTLRGAGQIRLALHQECINVAV